MIRRMNEKQIRMLKLLDKQVSSCQKCKLCHNGIAIPFWNKRAKYAIIGESPTKLEIIKQIPFLGAGGKILTDNLNALGFNPIDFLIVNSVQCNPSFSDKNYKPTEQQLNICQDYVRKYLKVVDPEKILCLGNYAKYMFNGTTTGIMRQRGKFTEYRLKGGKKYPVLFTVHPAYCVYQEDGIPLLIEDLKIFRDTKFDRVDDFLFTEDEFIRV